MPRENLCIKAARGLLQLPIVMAALLFLPAWTFDFWEAWVFIANFLVCSLAVTVYLAIKDPKLLERRMNVGPAAEKEKTQKIIMVLAILSFAGTISLPAIDHRLGWISCRTVGVSRNTYGASTIQIAEGQTVVSTGPYAIVRQPMYSGALIMILGIPLALGSWWGVLMFAPLVAGIIWRLLDEERFLSENLAGYSEYMNRVRYRLLPFVW